MDCIKTNHTTHTTNHHTAMNIKQITTRKTKENGTDKTDYSYVLEFNGDEVLLKTSWIKNGKKRVGSVSTLTESDMSVIPKVFPNLSFECYECDGVPTFNHGDIRYHLVSEHQVTIFSDKTVEI